MDKFHYNPVSVNEETLKFFPNTETLHCHDNNDEYIEGGKIIQYVVWMRRRFPEMKEIKKQNSGKNN